MASSSAASTSSSRKNGDGFTVNTATSSAIAVSDFSPPDEQVHVLQLLARRLGDDLDARLEDVLVAGQRQVRAAALEHLREHRLEHLVDGVEGLAEALAAGAVDARDRAAQALDRELEVGLLLVR